MVVKKKLSMYEKMKENEKKNPRNINKKTAKPKTKPKAKKKPTGINPNTMIAQRARELARLNKKG